LSFKNISDVLFYFVSNLTLPAKANYCSQYSVMLKNIFIVAVVVDSSPQSPAHNFQIGDRVLVGGVKPGIIVFVGEVHFSPGDWAGIVLDTPTGKNNGTVGGHLYFMCEPKRGVFSRLNKLTKLPGGTAPVTPMDSGLTARLEKSASPVPYRTDKPGIVASSSPSTTNSKPSDEKPPSPCQSTGSHHSDQQILSPSAPAPSTNHSDGDDHMTARLHFLVTFVAKRCTCSAQIGYCRNMSSVCRLYCECIATKWLELQSCNFQGKVVHGLNFLNIKFDNDILGGRQTMTGLGWIDFMALYLGICAR